MPRYDDRDRYGNSTRLYVGHLSSRTRSRDLEDLFSRYGRVRDVDLKHDFAFIEFSDPRDADDARYSLNGRPIDGSRIVVEFAKGGPRGAASSREYLGRGPPPGSGRCFNCGIDGHWARDCKAGDWKNKCYRCGERGHIERNCQNSPKSLNRSRTPPKRERSLEREERRSRSPRYSRSPKSKKSSPPPSKGRKRSPTPGDDRPQARGSPPANNRQDVQLDGSDYSGSPRGKSRSPSPVGKRFESPSEANGHSRSLSPRDDRSPMDDDGNERLASPRGSESPSSAQD
ncbi:hypothetical protein AQUCO_02700193v1 [Aquilegia coerulea]|uniref:Uncharacterized protein n=1 Tax=Aquilegia coerulea TaxID=218851 RepID=A0A2G5D5L7_AQUCA|nr:hypothetical protein AQUCO_02700193v1 [Aquilegia coerulea]